MAVSLSPDTGTNELEDEHVQHSRTSHPPRGNRDQFRPTSETQFKSTTSNIAQTFTSLNWIDENQRRKDHEGLKKQVRSHVRRAIHTKQRRLNAAARPRPLRTVPRRIVQRGKELDTGNSGLSDRQLVPETTGVVTQQPVEYPPSVAATPGPLMTPFRLNNHNAAAISSLAQFPKFVKSQTSQLNDMSAQSGQPHIAMHLARQQFKNTTPYALLLGDGAPILQIDGRNWPFLYPIIGNRPALSVWMPAGTIPIPNARATRPCLLKSSRAIHWVSESSDYLAFKGQAIRWVNSNLGNSDLATSEATIGVILCLMSFEVTRGNVQELCLHMNGIQRIINIRGGLSNFAFIPQFCWKLQLIDLLVALQTNSESVFPAIQMPAPSIPPHLNQSIGSFQIPDSPLFGTSSFQDILATSPFDPASRQVLQQMRDLSDGRTSHTSLISEDIIFSSTLSRTIHTASLIYNRGLSSPQLGPLPFNSSCNAIAVRTLGECLEDTSNDAVWTRYPGVLLWIVLTAYAAAEKLPERSFFATFVFRTGTSAVWWGTEAAGMAIRRFLVVKREAEGVRR